MKTAKQKISKCFFIHCTTSKQLTSLIQHSCLSYTSYRYAIWHSLQSTLSKSKNNAVSLLLSPSNTMGCLVNHWYIFPRLYVTINRVQPRIHWLFQYWSPCIVTEVKLVFESRIGVLLLKNSTSLSWHPTDCKALGMLINAVGMLLNKILMISGLSRGQSMRRSRPSPLYFHRSRYLTVMVKDIFGFQGSRMVDLWRIKSYVFGSCHLWSVTFVVCWRMYEDSTC